MRPVQPSDYHRNHLQLLQQLTKVTIFDYDTYCTQLENIVKQHGYIYVLIDQDTDQVIGSATLLIEHKLIRNCGKVGHIEDVVIDQQFRGQGLGRKLIDYVSQVATNEGCYKIILDCSEDNTGFYNKCGLNKKEIQMVKYINE